MPVFKLCLKVFKKNIPIMLIYYGVFIMVSVIMMQVMVPGDKEGFVETKDNIAFFASEDSVLVQGLKAELSKVANFIEIEDDKEALQDALYFRKITYILKVPEGFTAAVLSGETAQIEKLSLPDSASNVYLDIRIEQYMKLVNLYIEQLPDASLSEIAGYVSEDMSQATEVSFKSAKKQNGDQNLMRFFFNYMAYTLTFVVILGVSTIMLVFNKLDIKRRNACAPLSANQINLQFFMAITLFTFISWMILVAFCLVFDLKEIGEMNTLYYILNSLIFALCVSGLSFLIGSLVKGREAISAISNVVTLGSCFISGVFVPQEILGENVLKIARFLPTFWYVKANDRIAQLTQFDWNKMSDVIGYVLIELGFACVFFVLAMVVGKKTRANMM